MSASRAAPAWRSVAALTAMELQLATRRGESLVVTMLLPAAVLLFFGAVDVLPVETDRLVPASMAIAIVATGLVSLGIATAYDRHYGVLKRLGRSPLPRWGVAVAKSAAVLVTVTAQVALLLVIAVAVLGWRPAPGANVAVVVAAVALGTISFAGLGLTLAGTLRAETTLAVANGLFVALLLAGGLLIPAGVLPPPLGSLAALLPSGALAAALAAGLGAPGVDPTAPLALLAPWGVAFAGVAVRSFRVE